MLSRLQPRIAPTPASLSSAGEFLTSSAAQKSTMQKVGDLSSELKIIHLEKAKTAAAGTSSLLKFGSAWLDNQRELADKSAFNSAALVSVHLPSPGPATSPNLVVLTPYPSLFSILLSLQAHGIVEGLTNFGERIAGVFARGSDHASPPPNYASYGTPPPQHYAGYGAPPPHYASYGAPPPQHYAGYGPPPPPHYAYGAYGNQHYAAPPPQYAYPPPPPQFAAYGAPAPPQQQQSAYKAPPPQQRSASSYRAPTPAAGYCEHTASDAPGRPGAPQQRVASTQMRELTSSSSLDFTSDEPQDALPSSVAEGGIEVVELSPVAGRELSRW